MQVVMLKLTRHIALLSKIKIIAESGNSKVEKLVMTVKFRQYFLILIFGLLLSACQPAAQHNESLDSHQQAYTLHMGEKRYSRFFKI